MTVSIKFQTRYNFGSFQVFVSPIFSYLFDLALTFAPVSLLNSSKDVGRKTRVRMVLVTSANLDVGRSRV